MPSKGFSKFTPDRQEEYLEVLRIGTTKQHAAYHVGVSHETVRQHAMKDPDFAEAIKEAMHPDTSRGRMLYFSLTNAYKEHCDKCADRAAKMKHWLNEKPTVSVSVQNAPVSDIQEFIALKRKEAEEADNAS